MNVNNFERENDRIEPKILVHIRKWRHIMKPIFKFKSQKFIETISKWIIEFEFEFRNLVMIDVSI